MNAQHALQWREQDLSTIPIELRALVIGESIIFPTPRKVLGVGFSLA